MLITSFIRKYGLAMTVTEHGKKKDESGWEHFAFTCSIHNAIGASLQVTFRQGTGIGSAKPSLSTVLDCVASDISGLEDGAITFEEWAAAYGYDEDSRKAEAIFNACEEERRILTVMIGADAVRVLIEEVDRL